MSKLKKFGYRPQWGEFKNNTILFLATSQKQVTELAKAIGLHLNANDVKHFTHKAWGDDAERLMKGIELTEPCVYRIELNNSSLTVKEQPPVKLI